MTYTTQAHVAFGDMWTAGSHNILLDNIAYLKSQTDLLFVTARNNDGATINVGDPVVLDPSYISGLAVKMATAANDMRAFGVVVGASVASGANGIFAIGGSIQNINVTGAVVFGHSLVASATAHYAQDSGGGGWGPGVIGFALATQASGTGTISALIKPYPLFYSLATTIIRTQTNNAVSNASGSITAITSAISDGTNRLMLLFVHVNTTLSAGLFNAGSFTAFQNGAAGVEYFGYLLASAATANITITSGGGAATNDAVVVFLNGVNGGTPVGTYAAANASSASVSLVVPSVAGDLVVAGFSTITTVFTVSGRGAGQTNLADIVSGVPVHMVVDSQIATGANTTFTWTLSASAAWNAAGVAVKSA